MYWCRLIQQQMLPILDTDCKDGCSFSIQCFLSTSNDDIICDRPGVMALSPEPLYHACGWHSILHILNMFFHPKSNQRSAMDGFLLTCQENILGLADHTHLSWRTALLIEVGLLHQYPQSIKQHHSFGCHLWKSGRSILLFPVAPCPYNSLLWLQQTHWK